MPASSGITLWARYYGSNQLIMVTPAVYPWEMLPELRHDMIVL